MVCKIGSLNYSNIWKILFLYSSYIWSTWISFLSGSKNRDTRRFQLFYFEFSILFSLAFSAINFWVDRFRTFPRGSFKRDVMRNTLNHPPQTCLALAIYAVRGMYASNCLNWPFITLGPTLPVVNDRVPCRLADGINLPLGVNNPFDVFPSRTRTIGYYRKRFRIWNWWRKDDWLLPARKRTVTTGSKSLGTRITAEKSVRIASLLWIVHRSMNLEDTRFDLCIFHPE